MKRIANYLIALAVAAFTFTSCADVPSPFGDIVKPASGDVVVIEPSGTGTEADPYNVAAALELVTNMAAGVQSDKQVYIKGYVTEISDIDISGNFGNATYYISDNTDGTANRFYIYRGYGLGGKKFNEGATPIKVGDLIIIKSKVVNYQGNTPETVANDCSIVELNGTKAGGTTPATTLGTKDAPLTVAQALETIKALADNGTTEQDAYVTGKITKIKTADTDIAKYKNIDYIISDGTNELTVFRGKNVDNTDFTEAGQINVGDEVVVLGKLTKYVKDGNTTPEVAQGNYIVKLTKGSGGGSDSGLGTKDAPLTVAKALEIINALADGGETADAYVKGTISQVTSYNSTYKSITYYISDDGKTTNELQVYSGKGLNGAEFAAKEDLSVGDQVVIKGKLKKYVKNGKVTPEINQSSEIVTITKASGGGNGSASSSSITIDMSSLGVTNGNEIGSKTLSDGTVLTFDKGNNNNAPKYYDSGAAARMYPTNTVTITATKKIASIQITCSANNAEGKVTANPGTVAVDDMKVTISGVNSTSTTITNTHTGTGAASQLRIASMTITYAN